MNWLSFFIPQQTIFHSNINGEIKIREFLGMKTLYVNNVSQSGGEYVYMWRKVVNNIQYPISNIQNCLVLGVGGGTVIQILKNNYPDLAITGIEIDPKIVEIAQKYFNLVPDQSINLVVADAQTWLKSDKKKNYDLIIVDLYRGRFNPEFSRKKEFLGRLKNLLSKSGIILFNAHYQKERPAELEKFLEKCKQIFNNTEIVFSYPYNRVLLLKK